MVPNLGATIEDWHGQLPLEANAPHLKLDGERVLVNAFQKSRPKDLVDLDGSTDDTTGELLVFQSHGCSSRGRGLWYPVPFFLPSLAVIGLGPCKLRGMPFKSSPPRRWHSRGS